MNVNLKVCIVHSGGITPIRGGGIASVISNVINGTKDKIDYTLLTSFDKRDFREAKSIYPPSIQIAGLRSSGNLVVNCLRYLKKAPCDKFDIVHFHDFPMGRELLYAIKLHLNKLKLLYSHHIRHDYFLPPNKIILGGYPFLFNRFCKVWKKIVVHSRFMFSDLERFKSCTNRTVIIPNGVNFEEIQNARRINLLGEPSFLFVGHLDFRKGVDILLKAFEKLQELDRGNAHLHLVGSGSLEQYCREFVAKRQPNNVHFWGSVTEELKFRLLRSCNICVFPSRYEPFGIVLLEAMAAGKPIISTNVGGIPEIVAHLRNGILVKPDPKRLAQAMKFLLEREDLVEQLSKNNYQDVIPYSWKRISRKYVELYESVIRGDAEHTQTFSCKHMT